MLAAIAQTSRHIDRKAVLTRSELVAELFAVEFRPDLHNGRIRRVDVPAEVGLHLDRSLWLEWVLRPTLEALAARHGRASLNVAPDQAEQSPVGANERRVGRHIDETQPRDVLA